MTAPAPDLRSVLYSALILEAVARPRCGSGERIDVRSAPAPLPPDHSPAEEAIDQVTPNESRSCPYR
jgi:hypothetical protein